MESTLLNEWLTIREAAEIMKVGRRTLDKQIRAGKLRAFQVNGRDRRVHRDWLMAWAESLAAQPTPTAQARWRAGE